MNSLPRNGLAGFDFDVPSRPALRSFLDTAFRYMGRRSNDFGLEVTRRWRLRQSSFYVTVDGPLPAMQSFGAALAIELPAFAAAPQAGTAMVARQAAVRRVWTAYAKGLGRIVDMVDEVSEGLHATPHSYFFNPGRATHLRGKLDDLTLTLVSYDLRRVSPSQLGEEIHTVLELLLRESIGASGKEASFGSLVHMAQSQGMLSEEIAVSILELKSRRRDAKHRGQRITEAKVDSVFPDVLAAVHALLSMIRGRLPNDP
jgi:hypothetical protein